MVHISYHLSKGSPNLQVFTMSVTPIVPILARCMDYLMPLQLLQNLWSVWTVTQYLYQDSMVSWLSYYVGWIHGWLLGHWHRSSPKVVHTCNLQSQVYHKGYHVALILILPQLIVWKVLCMHSPWSQSWVINLSIHPWYFPTVHWWHWVGNLVHQLGWDIYVKSIQQWCICIHMNDGYHKAQWSIMYFYGVVILN